MNAINSVLIVTGFLSFSFVAQASDPAPATEPKWHCEVTKDGQTSDMDVPADQDTKPKAKTWCKAQGGKLESGKKHAHK